MVEEIASVRDITNREKFAIIQVIIITLNQWRTQEKISGAQLGKNFLPCSPLCFFENFGQKHKWRLRQFFSIFFKNHLGPPPLMFFAPLGSKKFFAEKHFLRKKTNATDINFFGKRCFYAEHAKKITISGEKMFNFD